MKKVILSLAVLVALGIFAVITFYQRAPVNKVEVTSQLVMLGDFDNDRSWTRSDEEFLAKLVSAPYAYSGDARYLADMNHNGRIEAEDIFILKALCAVSNPYRAEEKAHSRGLPFPRPRELFVYQPQLEYVQSPLFMLGNDLAASLPSPLVERIFGYQAASSYEAQLVAEIRDELTHLGQVYRARKDRLTPVEHAYFAKVMRQCETHFDNRDFYSLLLTLIGLVEDGETLYYARQDDFVKRVIYFRDDLRELIESPLMARYLRGEASYPEVYARIEAALNKRLDLALKLAELDPPRDFSDIQNYLDRIEWQKNKDAIQEETFRRLILYAQHDRRYLRAVSRTSPKHQDRTLKNHNLPMTLLFREALRLTDGDKKVAVALLDEAIRIPLGWVRGIPKELLPKSLALENFLLPGNKEDGADKSRHWNVFGGIAIYKSPQDALILALKREIQDFKKSGYEQDALEEFLRDTIANINGIYYVHSAVVPQYL